MRLTGTFEQFEPQQFDDMGDGVGEGERRPEVSFRVSFGVQ